MVFSSFTELTKHEETHIPKQGPMALGCGHCDFETNSGSELSEHIYNCDKSYTEVKSCNKCSYKTAVRGRLESHIAVKHSQSTQACNFVLEGKCTRAACTYRHDKPETTFHKSNKICNRGPLCHFKSINRCHYLHTEDEVHAVQKNRKVQNRVQGSQDIRSQTLWCKYQEACTNNQCSFRHFQTNMFQKTSVRGPMFM